MENLICIVATTTITFEIYLSLIYKLKLAENEPT